MTEPLVVFDNVVKRFGDFVAVKGFDLEIKKGEFLAIMGPSGSGKSTMMDILGCLAQPTEGEYYLEEEQVGQLSDNRLAEIRNRKIGFVFQTFNLLPKATALRNVEAPLIYSNIPRDNRLKVANEEVGLSFI